MVTSIANSIKQKFKGEGNPASTGLNFPDETRPPRDLNISNKAQSTYGDDQVLLQASNIFFQRVEHQEAQSKPSLNDQPKKDDRIHLSSENPDQTYWIYSVDEYADEVQYGPDVCLPIARASKMFWQKPLEPGRNEQKFQ